MTSDGAGCPLQARAPGMLFRDPPPMEGCPGSIGTFAVHGSSASCFWRRRAEGLLGTVRESACGGSSRHTG